MADTRNVRGNGKAARRRGAPAEAGPGGAPRPRGALVTAATQAQEGCAGPCGKALAGNGALGKPATREWRSDPVSWGSGRRPALSLS